jgi:hypothetical protein
LLLEGRRWASAAEAVRGVVLGALLFLPVLPDMRWPAVAIVAGMVIWSLTLWSRMKATLRP